MWTCKKCNEENEDSFDSCWECQTESDIGLKKSKIYHQELEHNKKKDSEDKEKESLIYQQLDSKVIQIWVVSIFAGLCSSMLVILISKIIGINSGTGPNLVAVATMYYSGSQTKKAYTQHLRKKIIEQLKQ